jgi:hypothetical protein
LAATTQHTIPYATEEASMSINRLQRTGQLDAVSQKPR